MKKINLLNFHKELLFLIITFTLTLNIQAQDAFITTWQTTTDNERITIPTRGGGYNYTVDWGDADIDTGLTGDAVHTYAKTGIYTVSITGNFPRIYFDNAGDVEKILTIEQWGNIKWSSMDSAFQGCFNVNITNPLIDEPDLSGVTNMQSMFFGARAFNGDVTGWNVSTVSNMENLFREAVVFNQDLSNWNVANVKDMIGTFQDATSFNKDIVNWNVSSVTSMQRMFKGATSFNQEINYKLGVGVPTGNAWDVSNVRSMDEMFYGATSFNGGISNWDVSNVNKIFSMFKEATSFNQDIGGWFVANVDDMDEMFSGALSFDQNIGTWDVSNVMNAEEMFKDATLSVENYDALLIGWNAKNLQPNVVFDGGNSQFCAGETARADMGSLDKWIITDGGTASPIIDDILDETATGTFEFPEIKGSALTTREAFYSEPNKGGMSYAQGDTIAYDVNGTNTYVFYAFDGSDKCSTQDSFTVTINSSIIPGAFASTWQTTVDNETITIPTTGIGYNYKINWGDGNVTIGETDNAVHTYSTAGIYTINIIGDFPRIFFNNVGDKDKILTIEQWGDIEWSSMENAFDGCVNLDIDNLLIDVPDLLGVISMKGAFARASNFNGDISSWDVSSVETMEEMFLGAENFDRNIGNWNISSVETMTKMFSGASSFNQDISFKSGQGIPLGSNAWDTSNISSMKQMFNNATSFNADIGNWKVGSVKNMEEMFSNTLNFNQDIGAWDVSSLLNATEMFKNITLSIENYDALLIGWETKVLQPGVVFSGGNSQYCAGASARAAMENADSWIITDGGTASPIIDNILDEIATDTFEFPEIKGVNLSGDRAFYTEEDKGGIRYRAGNIIPFDSNGINTYVFYAFDGSGSCISQDSFTVTIVEKVFIADFETVDDQFATGTFTFPDIVGTHTGNAAYFLDPNGQGTVYLPGDTISFSELENYPITVYIFDGYASSSQPQSFLLTLYAVEEINYTNSFTPNDDGVNDYFVIKNLEKKYPNFALRIYNRTGFELYSYDHNGNSEEVPEYWDGTYKGEKVSSGTYYYTLEYNDNSTSPKATWIYLNR